MDFAVPPPAKEGAVHYPCFDADVREGRKICLHQVGEDSFSLRVIEFMICKSILGSAPRPHAALMKDGAIGENTPAIVMGMEATHAVSKCCDNYSDSDKGLVDDIGTHIDSSVVGMQLSVSLKHLGSRER